MVVTIFGKTNCKLMLGIIFAILTLRNINIYIYIQLICLKVWWEILAKGLRANLQSLNIFSIDISFATLMKIVWGLYGVFSANHCLWG